MPGLCPVHAGAGARSRGLTMVEVIAAISLLAILAASTLITIIPVSRQTRLNQELQAAATAVRSVLEEVHSVPFNELLVRYPDAATIDVDTLNEGEIAISYIDPDADPREMQLTLSWESPDMGSMTRTYTTVRTE